MFRHNSSEHSSVGTRFVIPAEFNENVDMPEGGDNGVAQVFQRAAIEDVGGDAKSLAAHRFNLPRGFLHTFPRS